jgi:hypothetical protein
VAAERISRALRFNLAARGGVGVLSVPKTLAAFGHVNS